MPKPFILAQIKVQSINQSINQAIYLSLTKRFNPLQTIFKANRVQEVYLSVDITKYIRNSHIKFRFGISPILVHSLRLQNACLHRHHMSFV